jgi:MFS family permease
LQENRANDIRDGLCQAVTQGIGEHYFSAFALLLKATPLQIGLLSALPQLIGTWAQLCAASRTLSHLSRKQLLLSGSLGQALAWFPLLALPLLFADQAAALFIICAVLYAALGHVTVPAWNSLITDIVGPNLRGQYFGRRAQLMAVANFAALAAGGFLLHLSERWPVAWGGFAVIFLLAATARVLSSFFLGRFTDVPFPRSTIQSAGFIELLVRRSSTDFKRFLYFSGLMHAATLLAGPYFVVYLLHDLHLSYVEYGTWLAAQMVGQFISLKAWGRLGDRCGHAAILTVTGYLVPLLPMLYLFSTSVPYLVCVNLFGGMIWAGFSLGLQNYIFDAVPAEDKGRAVALASTINALGWFVGALAGGWLAGWLPSRLSGLEIDWSLGSNLPLVFLVSGCLRLVVSALFLPKLRELRTAGTCSPRRLLAHLPVLQPLHRLFLRTRS